MGGEINPHLGLTHDEGDRKRREGKLAPYWWLRVDRWRVIHEPRSVAGQGSWFVSLRLTWPRFLPCWSPRLLWSAETYLRFSAGDLSPSSAFNLPSSVCFLLSKFPLLNCVLPQETPSLFSFSRAGLRGVFAFGAGGMELHAVEKDRARLGHHRHSSPSGLQLSLATAVGAQAFGSPVSGGAGS